MGLKTPICVYLKCVGNGDYKLMISDNKKLINNPNNDFIENINEIVIDLKLSKTTIRLRERKRNTI